MYLYYDYIPFPEVSPTASVGKIELYGTNSPSYFPWDIVLAPAGEQAHPCADPTHDPRACMAMLHLFAFIEQSLMYGPERVLFTDMV